ncbi:MAG TPA: hypothetical protein EYP39_00290, partial [Ghiorsea sp.]|nr:hypothetical protein [Ghiorsea sp.]
MLRKAMHVLLGTIFVGLLSAQASWAVSFGKVDVASKMGEPFYAEVPLRLNASESLRKTSVEMGTSADYRILEVYRNPVLSNIRADIVDDERGARVTLSSDVAIDEAFFNVILKIRYGRSTHYKKVPVFLDVATISSSATPVASTKPLPTVDAASIDPSFAFATKVLEGAKPEVKESKEAFEDVLESDEAESSSDATFKPFDGWARTAKYGPMVYGDTITTVAQRLRLDDKFTNQQVMIALFEKNRGQFSKDNINLIKAGAYLDVPTANEVAQIAPLTAKQLLSEQAKTWKAMQKQSQYAALAEAQRTRYSSRVRIGEAATGMAAKPVVKPSTKPGFIEDKTSPVSLVKDDRGAQELEKKLIQKDAAFIALQQKMADLENRLALAEDKSNVNPSKNVAAVADATAAALDAQNKRLELVITRLKTQLEQAKTNVNSETSSIGDWMLYALIALAVLVLSLLVAVFMLMKKNRQHPAEKEVEAEDLAEMDDVADAESGLDDTKLMDADDFEMPEAGADNINEVDASGEMFGLDSELEEIPDLTDEETGEMEPFNADEAPDPNVNYLEDADVYLRYGMEDEAEQQVRMALKLQPDSPEAHTKMVQVQKAKGDETAANEAVAAAKIVLTGSALALFEGSLSGDDSAAAESHHEAELNDLDDLVPTNEGEGDAVSIDDANQAENSDVDFDFSDMGKSDDADETTVQEGLSLDGVDNDLADLDMGFGIAEQSTNETQEEQNATADESGVAFISGELDEVEVEGMEESEIEAFVDSLGQDDVLKVDSLDEGDDLIGVDSIDFGDIDLGETAEVQLDSGTQLVSSDGLSLEDIEGLNDFEIDKAKAASEAEKNATSVELNQDSDSPFLDASLALEEKGEDQAVEDWSADSIGTLAGEEEDPLSLTDEKKADAPSETSEIELEDLDVDFDLSDLDANAESSTETSDEPVASDDAADADINLDDLDMDFDLPDLDADEVIVADEADATFIMDADTESSTETSDESVALDDAVDAADADI